MTKEDPSCVEPPKTSIDTPIPSHSSCDSSPIEFNGDVNTNNAIPTQEDLKKIESLTVLDRDGKVVPFKSIYTGTNVARRVLIIFIRHFFCGVRPPPPPSFLLPHHLTSHHRTAKNTYAL